MAALVNELLQKHLDLKNAYTTLLQKQAGGGSLSPSENERLKRLPEQVRAAEQLHANERMRIDAEDAHLARYPSGRIPGARPVVVDETDEPALSALPPVPVRTRRALDRLSPNGSTMSREDRQASFRAVVVAALGGPPMSPEVLAATNVEGVPEDGGFATHPEVGAEIIIRGAESSLWIRAGWRVEIMRSNEKVIDAVDDSDETNDAEAGLIAEWTAEAAEATGQVLLMRRVTLHAYKTMVLCPVSNELSEDARADYLPTLEAEMSRAIAKKIDRAVLSGNGAGQPLGIIPAASTITVDAEASQAATFTWVNAVNMWARLAPGSHERSVWAIHPTLLPSALSMSMNVGASGEAGVVPMSAFAPDGRGGYTLLGRPVYVSSRVSIAGQVGDVVLVDPTQHVVGIRRQIAIDRSAHVYFTSDRLAIRAKFRGDAQPLWDSPKTLADGTTVGPAVVLAARTGAALAARREAEAITVTSKTATTKTKA
jgi:HK97 family phage major capsid protein